MRATFPFAAWLFAYRREWLRADVVAGLTAAAVVIPKAMALAVIAGLTVEAGLYTALAAMWSRCPEARARARVSPRRRLRC